MTKQIVRNVSRVTTFLTLLSGCSDLPTNGRLAATFADRVIRTEARGYVVVDGEVKDVPSMMGHVDQLCPWAGACWIYTDGEKLVGSKTEPDDAFVFARNDVAKLFMSFVAKGAEIPTFVQDGLRFSFLEQPELVNFASGGINWVRPAQVPERARFIKIHYRLQAFRGGNATFFLGDGAKVRVVNIDGATAQEDDIEMPLVGSRFGWATNGQDVGLSIWLAGFAF